RLVSYKAGARRDTNYLQLTALPPKSSRDRRDILDTPCLIKTPSVRNAMPQRGTGCRSYLAEGSGRVATVDLGWRCGRHDCFEVFCDSALVGRSQRDQPRISFLEKKCLPLQFELGAPRDHIADGLIVATGRVFNLAPWL